MRLFNSDYRASGIPSFWLLVMETRISFGKKEFIGSFIRKRYLGKAEGNELLQEPGPHKLEPE